MLSLEMELDEPASPIKDANLDPSLKATPALESKRPLRDYQVDIYAEYLSWRWSPEHQKNETVNQREALIAVAMGLGKTRMASECCANEVDNGGKVLWLAHRQELKGQGYKTITEETRHPVATSIHNLGDEKMVVSGNTVSMKTLGKLKEKKFEPSLIVIDEAHHAFAETYRRIKQEFPKAKILNLTATPYRADIANEMELGAKLGAIPPSQGIEMGYLSPYQVVGKLTHDFSSVRMQNGDYNAMGLSAIMRTPEMLQASTNAIVQESPGRRGIIYCCSKAHANDMQGMLTQAGLKCAIVNEEVSMEKREKIYQELEAGDLDQIININCLTEGFDLPAIDMVSILRPTKSAALYVQMLGRGLRLSPETGKEECIIIDALDVSKSKGKGKETPWPLEEEVTRYRATLGKPVSAAALYLSWFESPPDREGTPLPEMDTPEKVYSVMNAGLAPDQMKLEKLRGVWDTKMLPLTDPEGYGTLARALDTNGREHLHKLLLDKGYIFKPHGLDDPNFAALPKPEGPRNKRPGPKGVARVTKEALKNLILDLVEPKRSQPTGDVLASYVIDRALRFTLPDKKLVQSASWFKDPETGLGYITLAPAAKGTVQRDLLFLTPKGRALKFHSEHLKQAPGSKSQFLPASQSHEIMTPQGSEVSLGLFRRIEPKDLKRAYGIYKDQRVFDTRSSYDQQTALSKQLSRQIKRSVPTKHLSMGAATFLLNQQQKDLKALLRHIRDRVVLLDHFLDAHELNRQYIANLGKGDTYAPNLNTEEMVEKIWQGKTRPVPEDSIVIGKESYRLTFNREQGKFAYQNSSGKTLKQDDI